MKYTTFVFDDTDRKNIAGSQYTDLINFCFQYSKYFALTYLKIRQGVDPIEALEPYLYTSFSSKEELWYPYGQDATIKIYACTEESKAVFLRQTDNLFSWEAYTNHRAEDVTFFRENGQALFSLVTHEGIATIYSLTHEKAPDFVHQKPWEIWERDSCYIPVIWTAKYICDLQISKKQKQKLKVTEGINFQKRGNPYRFKNK